ncbi:MAG: hypothetical protein P8174_03250 [Gemmatimonadota bacterium]
MKTQRCMTAPRAGRRSASRVMLVAGLAAATFAAHPAAAQDANIMFPIDSIEYLLREAPFDIIARQGSRFEDDRTQRVTLRFADSTLIAAKWAKAPFGGETFNNSPRLELAAYRVQQLFLEPKDYVVPPTVLRSFSLDWYRQLRQNVSPTFGDTKSVLVVLQYWLFNVTADGLWDSDRFQQDSVYARHFADMNILTYLIHHNDANKGNLLISKVASNPRVFAVDNGLSFDSEPSDRGTEWRSLKVKRLPRATVERLRAITQADLDKLYVLAQFQVQGDGTLLRVPATAPENVNRGVTEKDGVIQFGLTRREIRGLQRRLERLLERVDAGKIEVF